MPAASAILDRMARLSEPLRVRLLRLLERHELTVAELCAVVQAPQSTVSRHLKVLADDQWVSARREGTRTWYRLSLDGLPGPAAKLWTLIRAELAGSSSARVDDRRLTRVLANRRTRTQAFFSSAAGRWDKMREELFGRRFDLAALPALFDADWTVGDLGCGTGQIAQTLAPFVAAVIAVDDSAAMLKAARQRLRPYRNVRLCKGEMTALPIDDDQLDVAICSLVLHHLPDPAAALGEVARVVKPRGRVMIVDMLEHDRHEYRQAMNHQWLGFSEKTLAGWLSAARFDCPRYLPLPVVPTAKGPGLFVATAIRKKR